MYNKLRCHSLHGFAALITMSAALGACSSKSSETQPLAAAKPSPQPSETSSTASVPPVPPAPSGAPDVASASAKTDVIPEMSDFMAALDGESASTHAALLKHGAKGKMVGALGSLPLRSPVVRAFEKRGDEDCYTLGAISGQLELRHDFCWKGGRITSIAVTKL